ncbi:hypothetical protein LWI29_004934 [Acer saccharum]|uniref:Uncharacterized protein n=1 Tax=Acer saccharum TaxID=4024 RepID=A0AA39SJT9_ACESA|nr:hypothetical protein LWI29_004934 [Acer saccharum]
MLLIKNLVCQLNWVVLARLIWLLHTNTVLRPGSRLKETRDVVGEDDCWAEVNSEGRTDSSAGLAAACVPAGTVIMEEWLSMTMAVGE